MTHPRSDRIFKQIFHNHPGAMINLLNDFRPLSVPIKSIEYLPIELSAELAGLYLAILYVRCRDRMGRHFFVEIQL